MVFQPRTISACIVVGDSRNLVILTTPTKRRTSVQCLRMTRARELLEFSRSTVDEIAATVGHGRCQGLPPRFP
jgi:AraC-like DNA-binding protein